MAGPDVLLPPVASEPIETARFAGLRYVADRQPGITRKRAGKGFVYQNGDGSRASDGETLQRIRSLVIPPAWTEVWICPHANGHMQAVGRDARGRKQYLCHERWREVRDETKFHRMLAFGRALPHIRRRVQKDLEARGLPREKVLALVVRLLETTCIRVGNDEYARSNGSYGLTTLKNEHVRIRADGVRFRFPGKSGKEHVVELNDRRLAAIVRRCQIREVGSQQAGRGHSARGSSAVGSRRMMLSRFSIFDPATVSPEAT